MAFANNDKKSDYLPVTDADCRLGTFVHFKKSAEWHSFATNKVWKIIDNPDPDLIGVVQIEEEEFVAIYSPSHRGIIIERELMTTALDPIPRFAYLLLEFEEGQRGYVIAYHPTNKNHPVEKEL